MEYLGVFERMFLTNNIEPFSTFLRSPVRIKQSSKRHFCDPSIAAALLGASEKMLLRDLRTFGFLFESLALRDLQIYTEFHGGKLYHYQDYAGNEIDAIIELPNGDWCAVEIRLGANKIEEAAVNLRNIHNEIAKEGGKIPAAMIVLCGMSNAAYRRPDGIYVIPLTSLRP